MIAIFAMLPAFAQAGDRPDLPKPYFIAPITADNHTIAQVWIFPREAHSEFAVEADAMIEALKPFLKDDLIQRLKELRDPKNFLTLRSLESTGLTAVFSEADLALDLKIPLKLRPREDLDITMTEINHHRYQRPSEQSGYFNLYSSQSYIYGNASGGDHRLPGSGQAQLVENISGFVFEANENVQESAQPEWQRQDVRISKDDEDRMIRYTGGDLQVPVRGFQMSPQLAGLSATRQFSIQPYQTFRPLSNSEIDIKRPSLVEIYVNGVMYSQVRVNPGRFNVRDFSLQTGQNNVVVKIRDDFGVEETFNFQVFFENTILAEGLNEFSYNAGVPWVVSGSDRAYGGTRPASSLYHRYGVSDQLTVGLNFQSFETQSLTGAEISHLGHLGYNSIDVGTVEAGRGSGLLWQYRSLDRMFGVDMKNIYNLQVEHRDRGFAAPAAEGSVRVFPQYEDRYDLQITRRLTAVTIAGVGGTFERGYDLTPDRRTWRANLIVPFNPWTRFEVTLSRVTTNTEDNRVFFSFYLSEPTNRYVTSAYYDSNNKSSSLSVQRNNLYAYNDYRATASVENDLNGNHADISGDYYGQRGIIHAENVSNQFGSDTTSTATVGLNTGVAWVGDKFTLTQPITESFVMIDSTGVPKDSHIVLNPLGDGYGEGELGPAERVTLRNYPSYAPNQVNLDTTLLPIGYQLDKEFFFVQPTYRSGVLIAVHVKAHVVVKGRLVLEDGKALSFAAGDILNAKGQLVDNGFFTGKSGEFYIEGLEPGDYTIMTDRPELGPINLHITDAANREMTTGNLVVRKANP